MRYKVREARSSVIGWIKMFGSTSSVLKQKKDENLANHCKSILEGDGFNQLICLPIISFQFCTSHVSLFPSAPFLFWNT